MMYDVVKLWCVVILCDAVWRGVEVTGVLCSLVMYMVRSKLVSPCMCL